MAPVIITCREMMPGNTTASDNASIRREIAEIERAISIVQNPRFNSNNKNSKYVRNPQASNALRRPVFEDDSGSSSLAPKSWVRPNARLGNQEKLENVVPKTLVSTDVLVEKRTMNWTRQSSSLQICTELISAQPVHTGPVQDVLPREKKETLSPSAPSAVRNNVWKRAAPDSSAPAATSRKYKPDGGRGGGSGRPPGSGPGRGRGRSPSGRTAPKRIRIPAPSCNGDESSEATDLSPSKDEVATSSQATLTDFAYASGRGRGRGKGRQPTVSSMSLVRVRTEKVSNRMSYDAGGAAALCKRGRSCKDPRCLLRHDEAAVRSSAPMCSFFEKNGMCSREGCPYRHVKVDPNAGICPRFVEKGYCEDPGCVLRHIKVRSNHCRIRGSGGKRF